MCVHAAESAKGKSLIIGFLAICRILRSNSRDIPALQLKESGQSNSQRPEWPSGPDPQMVNAEGLRKVKRLSGGTEKTGAMCLTPRCSFCQGACLLGIWGWLRESSSRLVYPKPTVPAQLYTPQYYPRQSVLILCPAGMFSHPCPRLFWNVCLKGPVGHCYKLY